MLCVLTPIFHAENAPEAALAFQMGSGMCILCGTVVSFVLGIFGGVGLAAWWFWSLVLFALGSIYGIVVFHDRIGTCMWNSRAACFRAITPLKKVADEDMPVVVVPVVAP